MPIVIGISPFRTYLDLMDSSLIVLGELMPKLNADQQQSVVDYASFLVHQSSCEIVDQRKAIPKLIERPAQETVVEAIDRLKESYFMLDLDVMLNDVAALMSKHILQGLEAAVVIDELQLCFQSYYRKAINHD